MKEDFLHYVWRFGLFDFLGLKTVSGEEVVIIDVGSYNENTGPDFLFSQLSIDGQKWVGNVEIHIKSSDWYAHNHEKDINYDAVILHVVYEHDVNVFMKNNKPLPVVELKGLINEYAFNQYQKLIENKVNWIPCQEDLKKIKPELLEEWFRELYFERLEEKSLIIRDFLKKTNNNFEEVLFWLLAKNFGLKVNAEAFLNLAQSIPFSVLQKESVNKNHLEALFFGQAGFLEGQHEEIYFCQLKERYAFLKHKYNLIPIHKNQFQFFRMRPNNFPTIRIAQLASLFQKQERFFLDVMDFSDVNDCYELFSVQVASFWKYHYTFDAVSKKSSRKLSTSFLDLVIINTIIPMRYVYLNMLGKLSKPEFLLLIQQLTPEKNAIISKFTSFKVSAKNALESQALLQLKNNYCDSKYCLKCAIGRDLLISN